MFRVLSRIVPRIIPRIVSQELTQKLFQTMSQRSLQKRSALNLPQKIETEKALSLIGYIRKQYETGKNSYYMYERHLKNTFPVYIIKVCSVKKDTKLNQVFCLIKVQKSFSFFYLNFTWLYGSWHHQRIMKKYPFWKHES